MLYEQFLQPHLRELNNLRLKKLLNTPKDVLFHDIDGFILGSDQSQNRKNLRLLAKHLEKGVFIAAVTGRGEPSHTQYSEPLTELLRGKVNLAQIPAFICPFNGAVIQHTFTREPVYDVPIDDQLYELITQHELIKALTRLTPEEYRQKPKGYEKLIQGGYIDPRSVENPGIRHNWSRQLRKRYQLSCLYQPQTFDQTANPADLEILQHYCEGIIPSSPSELAPYLNKAFAEQGINISTNTAIGFNVVDIARPEVSKQLAFEILYPFISTYIGKDINDIESVRACGVGGGDSPLYNDAPLMSMFDDAVTNNQSFWPEYTETGPIILDFPHIREKNDEIAQTGQFLTQLNKSVYA